MVCVQEADGDLGVPCYGPEELVFNPSARGLLARAPPQNLSPTAICCQTVAIEPLQTFQRVLSLLPFAGAPSSLGPGLGTVRSLGETLSPHACGSTSRQRERFRRHQLSRPSRGCRQSIAARFGKQTCRRVRARSNSNKIRKWQGHARSKPLGKLGPAVPLGLAQKAA
jgi:hypothetical protein